jgi:hypothetical protein
MGFDATSELLLGFFTYPPFFFFQQTIIPQYFVNPWPSSYELGQGLTWVSSSSEVVKKAGACAGFFFA